MSKRTLPLIVGNWKTTPETLDLAKKFIKQLDKKCELLKGKPQKKMYFLAVPDVFISSLQTLSLHGYIGAQNISAVTTGQTTGQTTCSQLKTSGAHFSIVGHSEVRSLGETVSERENKVSSALQSKMLTIVCFGESSRDKNGNYLHELENDIKETLSNVDKKLFENLVLAYEPVWAIGGKDPATPEECFEAVIAIRRALASLVGIDYAKKVNVLYGGAVTEETSKMFLKEGGVDGLLLGRASQDVSSFVKILQACKTIE